jgi:hypothetical protein
MNDLIYLYGSVSVPGSRFSIVAMSESGSPYAMYKRGFTGSESYDLSKTFPLMPYLIRMVEAEEDVPDYDDVMEAIKTAKDRMKEVVESRSKKNEG